MRIPTHAELYFHLYSCLSQALDGKIIEVECDPRLLRQLAQLHELGKEELSPLRPVLPDKMRRRVWLAQRLHFWRALRISLGVNPHPDALRARREVGGEIKVVLSKLEAPDKPKRPSRCYKKRLDPAEVKQQADIVKIIGQYTALRKAGKEYVGKCPLHDDRHPSLSVNPAKGLWHCFACEIGGDVFDFLTRLRDYSFLEAAGEVACG